MHRAFAWTSLGALALAISLGTASCGNDESTGNNANVGGGIVGNAGSTGKGGASAGGAGGGVAGPVEPKLGAACANDTSCGTQLKCVPPTDTLLSGGPPKGMCTIQCTTNGECQAIHGNSYCVVGVEGQPGYCFEGCEYGRPAAGTDKCHKRLDFACSPVGETAADMIPICQPACSGNLDCPEGLFCNTGSGLCVKTAPTGKELGEACDPTKRPDECKGLCVRNSADGPGTCTDVCALGVPCSRNTETPGGACLVGISLIDDAYVGDLGLCAQTCNCNADCRGTTFKCVAFPDENGVELYGAKGMCFIAEASDTVLETCGSGGSGGAGGSGSGGASGNGGAGGAKAGAGGAGGG